MFGLAGVVFGLALALARETMSTPRGWIVGIIVALFAASGMTLSAIGAALGTLEPVPQTFGIIGALFVGGAIVAGFLLHPQRFPIAESQTGPSVADTTRTLSFCLMFFGNFAICYAGLMFVSHGATILRGHGLSLSTAAWAPILLNLGYLLGALLGGIVAARFPTRFTPMVFCLLSGVSASVFLFDAPILIWAPALMVIGAAFGGAVSVFVMLFSIWYGTDKVGALFGRLGLSYGLAGLTAPSFTGWLFTSRGDYDAAVVMGAVVLFAGSLGLGLAKPDKPS